MAAGSVNTASTSWRLQPEHASSAQGLVVSPFAHLPYSVALLLDLSQSPGGAWLGALRTVVSISNATARTKSAAAIAFSWSGLQLIGLGQDGLDSFSPPFKEGMHQEDRRRRLGDTEASGTVVAGGPVWNGGMSKQDRAGKGEDALTAHVILLLYAANPSGLDAQRTAVAELLEQQRVGIVRRIDQRLRFGPNGEDAREHFGFVDGISQPVPKGAGVIAPTGEAAQEQARWHGVFAGDILMGHVNAHAEAAPGPVIASVGSPGNVALLKESGVPPGFRNMGLNGTYLVVRELRQDVSGFWKSVAASAPAAGMQDSELAERMVGRAMDGCPLHMPASPRANNFGYAATDVFGLTCPIGSHMRRANPRDGLPSRDGPSPDLSIVDDLLQSTKNHRILRRARSFGPDIADRYADDEQERGLLFMCLNTDIERQFEFIQQNWMLNPGFGTLFKETDPILGPTGHFTIPDERLRKQVNIDSYIKFVGGDYFFLPGIPALDYLSSIP